jgi:2-polyprenyl-3-methyl-5-hydroxy-6-metoxy-1,4-benzoquinol methylase/ribosomal protein S27E
MKEFDIRPRKLFNQYLKLSKEDNTLFFTDHSRFIEIECPGCGSEKQLPGLMKHGFKYVQCADCSSLYLSPRPPADMYDLYYQQAKSVKFWYTHFYKETAETRRQRIYQPRAAFIAEWARKLGVRSGDNSLFVDIGSGYGLFLEEVKNIGLFDRIMGIEPSPDLAQKCRSRGFKVFQKKLENMEGERIDASFATAFEVLEHVIDPLSFLVSACQLLRSGGLLMLTTLTVSGFDIQVLWENSKSVCPPHHINLLSMDGLRRLVERSGMELIKFSTPGELDVDIVRNIYYENPDIKLPRFIHSIINSSEKVRTNFQNFLKKNELSSHVRVIATQKKQ